VNIEGISLTDTQSGFRAYNKKALEILSLSDDSMGISTEILIKAKENGLNICEVPIEVKYGDNTSTQNPISHGISVVLSTIKYLSINKPLQFFGLPGFLSMTIGLFFWAWVFSIYSSSRRFVTNLALVAIGTSVIGLILLTTAINLWVLTSQIKEMNK
jgi:hypothetical protein